MRKRVGLHKDLVQCVRGNRVVLVDRRRQRTYDEAGVGKKWGVPPTSIPDYLALVGDSADGIPGIPRWGAKSASSVLARYGSIEDIQDDPGRWSISVRGASTLAGNLREMWDQAALYKRLATLRTDLPIAEGLTDLRWRGAYRESLEVLCNEIGDVRSMACVSAWAG